LLVVIGWRSGFGLLFRSGRLLIFIGEKRVIAAAEEREVRHEGEVAITVVVATKEASSAAADSGQVGIVKTQAGNRNILGEESAVAAAPGGRVHWRTINYGAGTRVDIMADGGGVGSADRMARRGCGGMHGYVRGSRGVKSATASPTLGTSQRGKSGKGNSGNKEAAHGQILTFLGRGAVTSKDAPIEALVSRAMEGLEGGGRRSLGSGESRAMSGGMSTRPPGVLRKECGSG
jgi:hypothetical protein